ncbi:hypothetical protein P692DRAFT_20818577 [Suillus brevipes Sb2]|nr:hypothetical protein P692DRAFT_20818577 [Suillus brevipes Sb2]
MTNLKNSLGKRDPKQPTASSSQALRLCSLLSYLRTYTSSWQTSESKANFQMLNGKSTNMEKHIPASYIRLVYALVMMITIKLIFLFASSTLFFKRGTGRTFGAFRPGIRVKICEIPRLKETAAGSSLRIRAGQASIVYSSRPFRKLQQVF